MEPKPLHIGVVGAGLAGLAAARFLQNSGHAVVVLDKGRGPGGRTSSRRADPFAFDHGAQYFTARDPEFRRALDDWLARGVVARWDGRIVSLSSSGSEPVGEDTERFVGQPRMNALAKHLAEGLDLHCGTRIQELEYARRAWTLQSDAGTSFGPFERLVITAPAPQAAALIGARSELGERAAAARMRPCWAVLLGLAQPYDVPFDGAFCQDAALSWVCRDSSKPGRPPHEAWVLHATPDWTEEHLDDAREDVSAALARELERLTGVPLPPTHHRDAHRWMFAQPASDEKLELPLDRERGLVLAGDGYVGGRVEGAYMSGLAAARAIAEALT